jgi:hypothetical protein
MKNFPFYIPVNFCRIWGSHSVTYEEFMFWDITLCSPLKVNLHLQMEATCFSKTSVDFQRTTQHYIPKDRTRQLIFIQIFCIIAFTYCYNIDCVTHWAICQVRRRVYVTYFLYSVFDWLILAQIMYKLYLVLVLRGKNWGKKGWVNTVQLKGTMNSADSDIKQRNKVEIYQQC